MGIDLKAVFEPRNDEYLKGDTLYCRACNTPRSVHFGAKTVRCNCECQEKAYEERKRAEEERENKRYFDNLQIASLIGERYKDASFDKVDIDFSADLKKAFGRCKKYCELAELVLQKGWGIYIFGSKGVGKTYLTACMANALMSKGYSVLFTNFFEIAKAIKATFSGASYKEEEIINKLATVQFLFIDDLGTERIATKDNNDSWLQEKVFDILNKRYNNRKPTVFTSNNSISELCTERGLAEKTVDRIMEMATAYLKIESESYRRKMRKREEIPF